MYDIVRYRVRYPYDIGRKIVRLFALIVRYLYVIAPYIGRTSAVHRSYIALVRCTLHLPQFLPFFPFPFFPLPAPLAPPVPSARTFAGLSLNASPLSSCTA